MPHPDTVAWEFEHAPEIPTWPCNRISSQLRSHLTKSSSEDEGQRSHSERDITQVLHPQGRGSGTELGL